MTEYALSAYGKGSVDQALEYFVKSNESAPNAWAMRNIAMLYRSEYKEPERAVEYIQAAFRLRPGCTALCVEVGATLTAYGKDAEWLSIYASLRPEMKSLGRVSLYRAVALIHLGRLDEAAEILRPGFEMPDIKEGELSVSQLWFELYRRIYAKENGVEYAPGDRKFVEAADAKYPIPAELDFRMH